MLEFIQTMFPSIPDLSFLSYLAFPFSLIANVFLMLGGILLFTNPTVKSLLIAWFMGKTWLLYERSNGSLQPLAIKLEDGIYEDDNIGMFVSTPKSTKTLPGGIRTALAYEGLASTIPSDFATACKKAARQGFDNIDQLLQIARESQDPTTSKPKSDSFKKLLESIDFSVVRNFFLYDFSPRGMRARINRKVAIEMQKEKSGALDFLANPGTIMMILLALVVIGVVVYPAVSNQTAVTECQNLLTACRNTILSGASIN